MKFGLRVSDGWYNGGSLTNKSIWTDFVYNGVEWNTQNK